MGSPSTAAAMGRRRHQCIALSSIFIVLETARMALAFCSLSGSVVVIPNAVTRHRPFGRSSSSSSSSRRLSTVTCGAMPARLGMMATSLAPPRTKAEKKDEHFKLKDGMVEFGSSQLVEAAISGASLTSMREYVADPKRIVYACWDHEDITPIGEGLYRLDFSGQSFLSVSIDMSVDIELRPGDNGTVQCKSVGYSVDGMAKILGQDFVDTFFLELEGELRVEETETKVRALTLKGTLLSGDVGVTIGGKMPGLLAATPEGLTRSAALGINERVLEYVSSTFVATIARDYRGWARDQRRG